MNQTDFDAAEDLKKLRDELNDVSTEELIRRANERANPYAKFIKERPTSYDVFAELAAGRL